MRERIIFLIFAFFYGVFALVLFRIQILRGKYYESLAFDNRYVNVKLSPIRGNIFDRNGKLIASSLFRGRIIEIDHSDADERSYIASLIGKYREILTPEDYFVLSSRMDILESHVVVKEFVRHYPYGSKTPHIVGYVNRDGRGMLGLERLLDTVLTGKPGTLLIPVNSRMRITSRNFIYKPPGKGKDIRLTLDMDLHRFIDSVVAPFEKVAVVVMKTDGEVIDIYSKPPYDPNLFVTGFTDAQWRYITDVVLKPLMNRAISGRYPPGSTFKILTSLISMDAGIPWWKHIYCTGIFYLGRWSYRDWDVHHNINNLKEALETSCDVYYYTLAKEMGLLKMLEGIEKSHLFGEKFTPLPEEITSFVPDTAWYRSRYGFYSTGNAINLSIGQGEILMTPVAIAMMTGAVANGGRMPYPKLYYGQEIGDTLVMEFPDSAFDIVKEAMYLVINGERGTAKYIKWRLLMDGFDGVKVAGKTGSAENPHSKKTHSLFTAFFPYDNPRFVITVVAETAGHGSEAAVPVALEIIEWLLRHYF